MAGNKIKQQQKQNAPENPKPVVENDNIDSNIESEVENAKETNENDEIDDESMDLENKIEKNNEKHTEEEIDNENDDDMNENELNTIISNKTNKKEKKKVKKGVIYMSRIPPFMKPDQVRKLLSEYGEIERIYLVEEDKTARKRRLKNGGNHQVNYNEGWIEFKNKKIAKNIAMILNTNKIGGKKKNKYHDDIWNLKYLKGFQWNHLTEKVAYENRVRDQKLRLEIAQATKENSAFMERVDQAKKLEKMIQRKHTIHPETRNVPETIRRTFRQNTSVDKSKQTTLDHTTDTAQVLGKVFKKRKLD